jgi:hypothetical protein
LEILDRRGSRVCLSARILRPLILVRPGALGRLAEPRRRVIRHLGLILLRLGKALRADPAGSLTPVRRQALPGGVHGRRYPHGTRRPHQARCDTPLRNRGRGVRLAQCVVLLPRPRGQRLRDHRVARGFERCQRAGGRRSEPETRAAGVPRANAPAGECVRACGKAGPPTLVPHVPGKAKKGSVEGPDMYIDAPAGSVTKSRGAGRPPRR